MNQPPNQRFFSFGDWIFDTQTRELRRGDRVTNLQNVPARLLESLLHSASADPEDPNLRRVLEYEPLKQAVWNLANVEDHNVHTAVRQIRAVLGDPKLVQNISGKGYRYVGPKPRLSNDLGDEPEAAAVPSSAPTITEAEPLAAHARSVERPGILVATGGLVGALILVLCGRYFLPAYTAWRQIAPGGTSPAELTPSAVETVGGLVCGALGGFAFFRLNDWFHRLRGRSRRWLVGLAIACAGGGLLLGAHLLLAQDQRPSIHWIIVALQGSALAVALTLPRRMLYLGPRDLFLAGTLPSVLGALTLGAAELLAMLIVDVVARFALIVLLLLASVAAALFWAVVFHWIRARPARALPILLGFSIALLAILPSVTRGLAVPESELQQRIVFEVAPRASPEIQPMLVERDVSELVFEQVTQRLGSLTYRRLIEGCDWLALFVPRFPDELLERGIGPIDHAYPLPLAESLDGATATRHRLEGRPVLAERQGTLATGGQENVLVASVRELRRWLQPGAGSAARVVSCNLLSSGVTPFEVSIRVLDSKRAAVLGLRTTGSTVQEAIDAAADELVRRLWPLHSALIQFNRAFDQSRTRDCVPIRSQAMLPLRDRSAFESLLVHLDPLTQSENVFYRLFAWDVQGAVYLTGLRDPERAESAYDQLRWQSERLHQDAVTRSLHADSQFGLASVAYAKRDWNGAVGRVDEGLEYLRQNGCTNRDALALRHLRALCSVRQSETETSLEKRFELLGDAHRTLADCVGHNPRAVANVHRLVLSQTDYLLGARQPPSNAQRTAFDRAVGEADALVREYPDDYNLHLWMLRVHRLAGVKGAETDFASRSVERFPGHVALMIEAAMFELNRGRLDAATRFADQAAIAFDAQVRRFFRTRPSIASSLWPWRSANEPQPLVPLVPRGWVSVDARDDAAPRGDAGPPVLSPDEGLDPEREEIDLHLLRARILRCEARSADAAQEVQQSFAVAATAHIKMSEPCEDANEAQCLERLNCPISR